MKHGYITTLIFLLLAGVSFAQGPRDHDGKVTVTDRQVNKEGNILSLSMDILVKAGAVGRCQSLTIIPEVIFGGQTRAFPYVLVNGINQDRMFDRRQTLRSAEAVDGEPHLRVRISGRTDTLLHYGATTAYLPWMDTAMLHVNCELGSCNDAPELYALGGDRLNLAPAVPYPVQPLASYFEPAREQKFRNVQNRAYLDFQAGKSAILPGFRNNPAELKKLGDMIDMMRGHEGAEEVKITALFIEGYASPEGPYELNERLSRERTTALKDYIKGKYGFPETMLKTGSVAEDWEGLEKLVGESHISHKEEILAIVGNTADFDRREKNIRAIGGGSAYRELAYDILPKLRRVEFRVDFSVRDYSDREVKVKYSKGENLEWMSRYELWRLASGHDKDSEEFADIMYLALKLFPDDTTVNINAAGVMLAKGDLYSAGRLLEKAGDDPRTYNNLGVLHLLSDDLDKAEELFGKAVAGGSSEAVHNLEEASRKRGNIEALRKQGTL